MSTRIEAGRDLPPSPGAPHRAGADAPREGSGAAVPGGAPGATHGNGGSREITASDVRAFLHRAERVLVRHRPLLDRLDARLGDGDHGENMSAGFGHAARALGADEPSSTARDDADLGELLRQLGALVVANVGGAGGSLYGTAFIEAGFSLAGVTRLDPSGLARALDAASEGIARRGRCRIGDKTIYDAMRPAADAFAAGVDEGVDLAQGLARAVEAARAGMRATTPMLARRGLALRLGERSRGHRDPGATSCFLLFRAMLAAGRDGMAGTA